MTETTTINVSTQRASFAAMLAALVTGINQDLLGADPYVVDGETLTRTVLLARIQAALDSIGAVKAARTVLQSAVAKQKAAIADARGLRAGIKRVAQVKFGPSSPVLQKLGFTPQRTPYTPVAVKAQSRAKAAATRLANGTTKPQATPAIPAAAPAVPATPATKS